MRAPVPMRLVASDADVRAPGDYTWEDGSPPAGYRYLTFNCPRAAGCVHTVPVFGHPQSWSWNGNRETPTLTPSLRDVGECGWHGFVTNGQLVSCADSR